jgi:serine/threonine-protein kinase
LTLASGARLGPYEVLAPLGAGGMGEVYRAKDTKLGRDVALKILPASFTNDPERVARFRREAQVLASLNHPHIAQIHGMEEANGTQFLVLELVDGESLDKRIARGPIPIDEALAIAKQIAEALEAAHEKGIIHRDLKPANIALTKDGQVKVLDFGLAKAVEATSGSVDAMNSPTITSPAMMTGVGVILGTAAYMSPEQAKGRGADKRSDVWAFGCVVYEMLTGRRAFGGEDVSDTIAFVHTKELDWNALPSNTPAPMRRLLQRCLEKDRKRRLDSAADARLEIEDSRGVPTTETVGPIALSPHRAGRWLTALAVIVSALTASLVTWAVIRSTALEPAVAARFMIIPARAQPLYLSAVDRAVAVSPDGRHLVYRTGGSALGGGLTVRNIDQLETQLLTGVTAARWPFFSADGQWVGFFEGVELKKVPIHGGSAITLCRVNGVPRGASWGDDNTIVFAASDNGGLRRVSADGGEPTSVTVLDQKQHEAPHTYPSVLPAGRGVLFTIGEVAGANSQVAVLDLKTGDRKVLLQGSEPQYMNSGYLIYASGGTLRAVRFDLARLEVRGDPVPVVDRVMTGSLTGVVNYAVSRTGTLVYVPGGPGFQSTPRSLVWVDRRGHETPIRAPLRAYTAPRLSPDGTRVALEISDQEQDLWIWDLGRETLTRLTFDSGADQAPVWTPDGRRIIFSSSRHGVPNLYAQAADGTGVADRLTTSVNPQFPTSVTPDGTGVAGFEVSPATGPDVFLFPIARASSRREPDPVDGSPLRVEFLIQTSFVESNAAISPDGHFVAYQSNESGRFEIYVRPFPQVNAGRWQVSNGGGQQPAWARSGRELFYLDSSNTLTVVPTQITGPTISTSNPAKPFEASYAVPTIWRTYDVSSDGQRFLMIKENITTDQGPTPTGIDVVTNWSQELKARLPTK